VIKLLVTLVVAASLALATSVPALAGGPPGAVGTRLLNLACVLGVPAGLIGSGFQSVLDFDNFNGTRTHVAVSPGGVTLVIIYVDLDGSGGFFCGDVISSLSIISP